MTEPDKPEATTPTEPLTAPVESLMAIHVLFENLKRAGFSEDQALALIAKVVIAHMRAGGGNT